MNNEPDMDYRSWLSHDCNKQETNIDLDWSELLEVAEECGLDPRKYLCHIAECCLV